MCSIRPRIRGYLLLLAMLLAPARANGQAMALRIPPPPTQSAIAAAIQPLGLSDAQAEVAIDLMESGFKDALAQAMALRRELGPIQERAYERMGAEDWTLEHRREYASGFAIRKKAIMAGLEHIDRMGDGQIQELLTEDQLALLPFSINRLKREYVQRSAVFFLRESFVDPSWMFIQYIAERNLIDPQLRVIVLAQLAEQDAMITRRLVAAFEKNEEVRKEIAMLLNTRSVEDARHPGKSDAYRALVRSSMAYEQKYLRSCDRVIESCAQLLNPAEARRLTRLWRQARSPVLRPIEADDSFSSLYDWVDRLAADPEYDACRSAIAGIHEVDMSFQSVIARRRNSYTESRTLERIRSHEQNQQHRSSMWRLRIERAEAGLSLGRELLESDCAMSMTNEDRAVVEGFVAEMTGVLEVLREMSRREDNATWPEYQPAALG
jgi:hypothetical protein